MNYGQRFVTLYRRQESRPSPRKTNAKSWRFSSPLPPWHSRKKDRKISGGMTINCSSVKELWWEVASKASGPAGRGVEGGGKKNEQRQERSDSRLEGWADLSEEMLQNEEEQPLEGRVKCRWVSWAWTHGRDTYRGRTWGPGGAAPWHLKAKRVNEVSQVEHGREAGARPPGVFQPG